MGADLDVVGERRPASTRTSRGIPFVGRPGKAPLEQLLARDRPDARPDVYVANTLKCRPPGGNRDPLPGREAEVRAVAASSSSRLIRPKVSATARNHATKQLTGKETGITRVHGQPQQVTYGSLPVTIFPIYHPAAALYTPAMLKVLEEDFAKIPALLDQEVARRSSSFPSRSRNPSRSRYKLGLF
jgi:DNA polymerase